MNSYTKKRIGLLLGTIVLAGAGYFAWMMLPGGALEGTPAPTPADWSTLTVPDVVELETNPVEPYSVKIWVVPMGDRMYVHAGDNHNQWVRHIEQDPAVRLLVGDSIYELTATRVTTDAEFSAFAAAYEARYGTQPRNTNVGEVYLFRLTAP